MKPRFLPTEKQKAWLSVLVADRAVFFPAIIKDQVHWQRLDAAMLGAAEAPEWGLERIRASEPIKSFFFNPREKVATFPDKFVPPEPEKRVLFGASACDAVALRVNRKMFVEGDFKDETYARRRAATCVVVADCPSPADTCFCNLVGNRPFAGDEEKDEADVGLSVVDGGWVLEPLTERGEELLGSSEAVEATEAQLAARQASREAAGKRLAEVNPKRFAPDTADRIWQRNQDKEFWSKHAADCVECYGCLMACPTCYCFLLYDKARGQGEMERTKVWDACYIAAYARVGGGANPRAEFVKRFYNRFFCKFSHFKTWQGMPACSGCGRCTAVCMGRIDVRKVVLDVQQ